MAGKKIKVIRSCGASGKSLEAGKIYSVPEDVSEIDASILVTMKKAEYIQTVEENVGAVKEAVKEKKKRTR